MNIVRLFFTIFICCWTTASSPSILAGGERAAYRNHYKGSLLYAEGKFQRSISFFEKAYHQEPSNFNFALSLALALSRTGKADEGLTILNRAKTSPDPYDPDPKQTSALQSFYVGMVHNYGGRYWKAIQQFEQTLSKRDLIKDDEKLSIVNNALGYATLMNQGKGAHKKADLGPHYHIHQRDMVKALNYFNKAIELDPANTVARENYQRIVDSLAIRSNHLISDQDFVQAKKKPIYTPLPNKLSRALSFADFDEVLFLLDISGSMVMEKVTCKGETRFKVMKETALFLLEQIPDSVNLGIATIGGDCGTTPRLWHHTGKLTHKDMRYELEFLVPDGTTPLLTILADSPELFSEHRSNRKAIFFVSDGANICKVNGLDICQWAEDLFAEQKIYINVLTFLNANLNNTEAFTEYTCLADNTKGKILYLDNYRCSLEYYDYNLMETCHLTIPEFQKVNCWGPAVKSLWAIFEED